MDGALYILIGLLVCVVVAMQLWMARAQSEVAGDRGRLVAAIRILNVVLVVAAVGIVAYALATR